MTTYAVHAQIITHDGDFSGSRSVPTFYLFGDVQGITDREHAARIAEDILTVAGGSRDHVIATAYAVDLDRELAEVHTVAELQASNELGRLRANCEQMADAHGRNAASWVIDGNTSTQTARYLLDGINDGDPMVMDSVREPNLSGEFAGEMTPAMLASDLGIPADSEHVAELEDIYLAHVSSAFWTAIEQDARRIVGQS